MEAWQHVKLSLTNRSIGLFYPANASRAAASPQEDTDTKTAQASVRRIASNPRISSKDTYGVSRRPLGRLVDLVVIARGPHPIPSRTRP